LFVAASDVLNAIGKVEAAAVAAAIDADRLDRNLYFALLAGTVSRPTAWVGRALTLTHAT
jgi:hypothetical protein